MEARAGSRPSRPEPRSGLGRRAFLGLSPALLAAPARAARPVVVASKIDTEGALLGSLILLQLRAHGIPVTARLQLGPTRIVRAAILGGAVDLYPEYTGNGAFFFHCETDPAWHDPARAYRLVAGLDRQRNGLVWLNPAPADNGWTIALPAGFANVTAIASLADLAGYIRRGGRLRLAASVEFVESPAALPAFEAAYGFRLRQEQLLELAGGDTAATIRVAAERISGINAAMAYRTDGALTALRMAALTDPKHAQLVYQPAPVIRAETLRRYPAISAILAPVFRSLSTERLRDLNGRIAADGADPMVVARDFLSSQAVAPA